MKSIEWQDVFHPFNSLKHFSQIYRWSEVGKTPPPAPASISVDPSNGCQLECIWCNSAYIRHKNPRMIGDSDLLDLADSLPHFTDHPRFGHVEAACVAGGGEPLTNPDVERFINRLYGNGVHVGLITNGILLGRINPQNCEWVGVSVDAGTKETYEKLKKGDYFDLVIHNIEQVVKTQGRVSLPGKGHGVNYKFVMHPGNVREVYEASRLARELGCRSIHIRPYAVAFKGEGIPFTEEDIEIFRGQLTRARELETDDFKVYGVTHKFGGDLYSVHNDFKHCYATAFSCTIQPPTSRGFDAYLCCDRRGDERLRLQDTNPAALKAFWGSKEHLDLIRTIDPQTCPRCTRGPHNRVYEKTIGEENLSHEFG
jgi:MoaA/NifB/PqqE/SkfB family radical SAM enzyme